MATKGYFVAFVLFIYLLQSKGACGSSFSSLFVISTNCMCICVWCLLLRWRFLEVLYEYKTLFPAVFRMLQAGWLSCYYLYGRELMKEKPQGLRGVPGDVVRYMPSRISSVICLVWMILIPLASRMLSIFSSRSILSGLSWLLSSNSMIAMIFIRLFRIVKST